MRSQVAVAMATTLGVVFGGAVTGFAQVDPCAPGGGFEVDCLGLNEIQVVGSHNSYHIQPVPLLQSLLVQFDPTAIELEYTHLPLDEQFEFQGVRQIELDVFADPNGGIYAEPIGLKFVTQDENARIPELDAPGTKVLHIQHIDYETTCGFLAECLGVIKDWSDAHPRHFPLMILIEAKDEPLELPAIFDIFEQFDPIPYGAAEFDALDAEIRSVLPPEKLITPDDVRGARATLEEAVLLDGWPTLGEARGKILFALDNGGSKKASYIAGHPSLAGRVMFTSSLPGEPEAAFAKLNSPFSDLALIQQLVAAGFIVRTRADAGTLEARSGDTTRRDTALASGAQYVSTDYPSPESNPFGTGYFVEFPGGLPGRCNPISAPLDCDSSQLDDQTLAVDLDIKPGSCPNSWNRDSRGVLPVTLVGTAGFDIADVDLTSVSIARADGVGGSLAPHEGPPGPQTTTEDSASPFAGEACACEEGGPDGTLDLALKFKTEDLVAALELEALPQGDLVSLVVSGNLLDGTPFEGSDCVRLVPPGSQPNLLAVASNAAGAWIDLAPLDDQLDGGGFADFERSYPTSTEADLTASASHAGRAFLGWRVDGGPLMAGQTLSVVVNSSVQNLEAVYASASPRCGLGYELAVLLAPLLWLRRRRRARG